MLTEMKFESDTERRELIHRISRDDETAFRRLFDFYYQKLFHAAFYFLKSKELAEEAVADVFYCVWKRRRELPEIDDMNAYLYISVKNQSLQYLRRSPLSGAAPGELYTLEWIPDPDNPERALLDREYKDLIQKAIDSLPAKCREVFRLVFSDKLKHKEIAALLDISEKTVEAHIAKAYARIARYVNRKYDDNDQARRMLSLFF